MPGSILGTSVRRVEDLDLITGASTYVGNLALPGSAAPRLRPLPAGARPDHRDRHRRGRRGARGGRRVHRRRPGPARPPRPDGGQPGAAAAAAGHRPGAVRGRGRRRRRRPRRRRPRSTRSSWWRWTTTRCRPSSTRRPRSPPGAPPQFDGPDQPRRRACAPAATIRWPTPRSWSGPGWSTSGSRCMPMEGNAIAVQPGPAGRRRRRRAHELTIWVSTQMPHGFRAQAAGSSGWTRSASG